MIASPHSLQAMLMRSVLGLSQASIIRSSKCIALLICGALSIGLTGCGSDVRCKAVKARGFVDKRAVLGLPGKVGYCLGFVDFNGNQRDDLVLSIVDNGYSSVVIYPSGPGGQFEEPLEVWPRTKGHLSCTVGDYDGDGHIDLLLGSGEPSLILLKNSGGFSFIDESLLIPKLSMKDHLLLALGFFDADNDGDLDIFVGRKLTSAADPGGCEFENGDYTCPTWLEVEPKPPLLLVNQGNNFVLREDAFSLPWAILTNAIAFLDYNRDGLTDVFLSSDYSQNMLYRNDGGTFSIVDVDFNRYNHGMGVAFGDFDEDGRLDIYSADLGPDNLLFGLGPKESPLIDRSQDFGIYLDSRYTSSWAPLAEDFDNDGETDLYLINSARVSTEYQLTTIIWNIMSQFFPDQVDYLYYNLSKSYQERILIPHSEQTPMPSIVYGISAASDFDGDGDLDIATASGEPAAFRFLENQSEGCNYLNIRLQGKAPNTYGLGARIELVTQGGRTMRRFVTHARGSLGISSIISHFGLCRDTEILRVDVYWPSGTRTTVENIDSVNETLVILEE
jgi:hypothetical protein